MKETDISNPLEQAVTIVEKQAVVVDDLPQLDDREAEFVANYVGPARFNAMEAARLMGYGDGSAGTTGHRLVTRPHVRAHIDAILAARALGKMEVLDRWSQIANAPTTHFMQIQEGEYTDEHGKVHPAIIRQDYSAMMKALEGLARYHAMDNSKVQLDIGFVPKRYLNVNDDDL